MLSIHIPIHEQLHHFRTTNTIPNLLFYGPQGVGKRTLVFQFMQDLYPSKESMRSLVMYENCAHGRGIKFIRDELKLFAKTNISESNQFKTIVLLNVDQLTLDAQSALRRCIELFSHHTRFILIAENKYNLMKPILSRFCEIYVSTPVNSLGKPIDLHQYHLAKCYPRLAAKPHHEVLVKRLQAVEQITPIECIDLGNQWYQEGISSLHVLNALPAISSRWKPTHFSTLLLKLHQVLSDFHHEAMAIGFVLHMTFLSSENDLNNLGLL